MIQDICTIIQGNQTGLSDGEQNQFMQHLQLANMELDVQQIQEYSPFNLLDSIQHMQNFQYSQQNVQHSSVAYQHNNEQLMMMTTPEPSHASIFVDDTATTSSIDTKCDGGGTRDAANTSDASTIEDVINESDIPNTEDAYTYLQGLNSGNLMQFSQQSALQEMMLNDNLDVKPNLNILPTLDSHDVSGYKFQINVSNQRKGRSNWVYSEALNKVYIRMNDIFNVEASYLPQSPMPHLRIRVLLCFVKEVSEPVLRCQNHMSVDTESDAQVRQSFLRCENPCAEYHGKTQGKNINDRLSIVIPLNSASKSNVAEQAQKQTIALKFACQNSCTGRKETSIIFILESLSGLALSQRVIDVKICSCPKRDKAADERCMNEAQKRKMDDDLYPRKKKLVKEESKSPFSLIKTESCSESDFDENSNDSNFQKAYDIQQTPSGSFRLVLEVHSKDTAQSILESSLRKMALEVLKSNNKQRARLKRIYRRIHKLHDEISK